MSLRTTQTRRLKFVRRRQMTRGVRRVHWCPRSQISRTMLLLSRRSCRWYGRGSTTMARTGAMSTRHWYFLTTSSRLAVRRYVEGVTLWNQNLFGWDWFVGINRVILAFSWCLFYILLWTNYSKDTVAQMALWLCIIIISINRKKPGYQPCFIHPPSFHCIVRPA